MYQLTNLKPILAGGNVDKVVNALSQLRANIPLEFERAAAIIWQAGMFLWHFDDVNPKVIETPLIAAIAKDGIELKAKARLR